LGGAVGGALSVPALGRLGSSAAATSSSLQGEGVRGGALRVAMAGEPPTLDIHQTTAGIVSFITWSMYEPLFTYDESYQLIPMLAESHEVSDDGLTNVLRLRAGVPFHNGEEMTAADVIASITRWGALSGLGQGLLDATDEMREVDAQTVEFHMKRPYGTFASSLAISYQGCAIYPKSVIDAAGDTPLEDTFIGTGPYQLAERVIDQYVRLTRGGRLRRPQVRLSRSDRLRSGRRRSIADRGTSGRRLPLRLRLQLRPVRDDRLEPEPRRGKTAAGKLGHARPQLALPDDGQRADAAGVPGRARP
jgi:ABC-type transport system substrate-binding protein